MMSNTDPIQANQPPGETSTSVPSDVDVAQYEREYQLEQQDVMPIAKFFNQVGGDLSSLERHNVDGKRVLKLDKDKVIPPTFQQSSQPRNSVPHTPPIHAAISPPSQVTGGVTLKDLEHVQKIEKKLSTTNRKVTTIDKRIATLESIVNLPKRKLKYNVKTSDVDCTTSNTDVLVTTICDQINNGATNISISRC
jgi:hypothetical protein